MTETRTCEMFDDYDVSLDDVFSVLGNERRRLALGYLKNTTENGVDIGDLATSIAAWERGKSVEKISYDERKSVQTSLYQLHLPKMDELRFVEFDRRGGTVRLTDLGAEITVSVGVENETWESSAMAVVLGVSTALYPALVIESGALMGKPALAFGAAACLGVGALLSVAYGRWVSSDRTGTGLPVPEG